MSIRSKKNTRKYKKVTRKSSKINKRNNRKKRNKKSTRKYKKGGNGDKVNCCMCGKEIDVNKGSIPRVCLAKYGLNAHRICQDCWWDPEIGFAREDGDHSCPGCRKNMPLTNITNNEPKIIDLTED